MKILFVIPVFLLVFSCNKESDDPSVDPPVIANDTVALLNKRWLVFKDSITNDAYVYPDGSYPIPGLYIGKPEDYYLFTPPNSLSMHENNMTLSSGYKLMSNNKILIDSTLPYYIATITMLTTKNLVLEYNLTSSTNGKYHRRTQLYR